MLNVHNHLDALVGAVIGATTSASLAAAPGADQIPLWGHVGLTVLGALLPLAVSGVRSMFRGRAASDRVRVTQLRKRAELLRTRGRPGDAELADQAELQADELEADAARADAQAAEK